LISAQFTPPLDMASIPVQFTPAADILPTSIQLIACDVPRNVTPASNCP